MKTIRELLLSNQAWSHEMRERKQDFFAQQIVGQRPEVMWIGSSDSRVSPEQMTQTRPGELYIHRNTANLVYPDDDNFMADLQYAVDELKVPHIILCGHLGCAGIAATLRGETTGHMHSWLRAVREVQEEHRAELDAISNFDDRVNRLVELNVREQLIRLGRLDIIAQAYARGQELTLHGWVYDLRSGLLSELYEIASEAELDDLVLPANIISIDNGAEPRLARAG
jgi:carbonic anhydrase